MNNIFNFKSLCCLILLPLPTHAMQNADLAYSPHFPSHGVEISRSENGTLPTSEHDLRGMSNLESNDSFKNFLKNFFPWLTFRTKARGYSKSGNPIVEAEGFKNDHDEGACVTLIAEMLNQNGYKIISINFFSPPVFPMPVSFADSHIIEPGSVLPSSIKQNTVMYSRRAFNVDEFASYYLENLPRVIENSNDEFSVYAIDIEEEELIEIHGDVGKLGDDFVLYISSCRVDGEEFSLNIL